MHKAKPASMGIPAASAALSAESQPQTSFNAGSSRPKISLLRPVWMGQSIGRWARVLVYTLRAGRVGLLSNAVPIDPPQRLVASSSLRSPGERDRVAFPANSARALLQEVTDGLSRFSYSRWACNCSLRLVFPFCSFTGPRPGSSRMPAPCRRPVRCRRDARPGTSCRQWCVLGSARSHRLHDLAAWCRVWSVPDQARGLAVWHEVAQSLAQNLSARAEFDGDTHF